MRPDWQGLVMMCEAADQFALSPLDSGIRSNRSGPRLVARPLDTSTGSADDDTYFFRSRSRPCASLASWVRQLSVRSRMFMW